MYLTPIHHGKTTTFITIQCNRCIIRWWADRGNKNNNESSKQKNEDGSVGSKKSASTHLSIEERTAKRLDEVRSEDTKLKKEEGKKQRKMPHPPKDDVKKEDNNTEKVKESKISKVEGTKEIKKEKKNEENKSKNDDKNEDNNAKKGDAADEKKKRVRKNLAKMKTASNVVVKAKKNKGCVIS